MSSTQEPPPWWPADEPWPPDDWKMARRQFAPRIAALMLGLTLLVLASCILLYAIYWDVWRKRRPGRRRRLTIVPFGGLVVLILLAYVGTRGFHSLRTNALALDEVAMGVDRIAAGEYDIELAERGWPETQDLTRSVMLMAARLRNAEAQRVALQAEIAHELRTPLSVIQGTTEGMLDGVYPRDDDHLHLIVRRSRMMAELLEDFRTVSTAEAGALQLHRERVDVGALLDGLVQDYRDEATRTGVGLTRAGMPEAPAEVDPVRLMEVLDNLLRNALRHTPEGGEIEIGVERSPDELVLWVRDNGVGIAADQLPFVFDRFAKSADSGGSGLGLAIAKRLVEAHGGVIGVESVEGNGATFTIRIPQP
ncbi:MAG: HAMP domain-containing sensor histidine kinase [Thermomicrobiales bacterium]